MTGAGGERYLFTGDTIFPAGDGTWSTFVVTGRGDAAAIRDSVKLTGSVEPDIVISSAFAGETAIEAIDAAQWSEIVEQALASVKS